MLHEMSIENLGVITSARVEFSPGLTAITGETGAGKTMVLTGLTLLMGGKSDVHAVRAGADSALVEGRVTVDDPGFVARVDDAGAALDEDGSLLIARTVAAQGRSRTHVGGRAVPRTVLGELAEDVVTIHGQSDQMRLRAPQRQREALDDFAGQNLAARLDEYRALWNERATARTELTELTTLAQERAREAELLRLGLAEIERIEPAPGEDVRLAQDAERLANAEELRTDARGALVALAGDDLGDVVVDAESDVVALVDRARRLTESGGLHDARLAEISRRLADVAYAVADIGTELSAYLAELDADPARLEAVEARRAELGHLTRTYGSSVDEVLAWASTAGLRLLELEDDDERISALSERVAALDHELVERASVLTTLRTEAAAALGDAVSAELAGLAMSGATLDIEVSPLPEPGPWGADSVQMLLTAHRGGTARPLGKGASGGELSRVMLAIEVALATSEASGARRTPTMIFDEVDAGVGGKAAVEIGRRLARLARTTQVIVVTHLPQVAAFADAHLVVTKGTTDDGVDSITQSGIRLVDDASRVQELARMLSGQEDSEAARQHASELLELSAVRL
ncbi:DNA repair protein RecN [Sanguibacter suaedae]|uniref:DNA repair protein RecN n=1 Tax=Sanguibacter suaedae TaxID=2795737 RepID=A0A934IDC7_9MICO|nr:DNA repair protein RecN [Sanguibacter suaedae]MBI9116272.1 DNA repair protein RecN [Sanguibacter suaedae]